MRAQLFTLGFPNAAIPPPRPKNDKKSLRICADEICLIPLKQTTYARQI